MNIKTKTRKKRLRPELFKGSRQKVISNQFIHSVRRMIKYGEDNEATPESVLRIRNRLFSALNELRLHDAAIESLREHHNNLRLGLDNYTQMSQKLREHGFGWSVWTFRFSVPNRDSNSKVPTDLATRMGNAIITEFNNRVVKNSSINFTFYKNGGKEVVKVGKIEYRSGMNGLDIPEFDYFMINGTSPQVPSFRLFGATGKEYRINRKTEERYFSRHNIVVSDVKIQPEQREYTFKAD